MGQPIETNGKSVVCCVKTPKVIELLFYVMSEVGLKMGELR